MQLLRPAPVCVCVYSYMSERWIKEGGGVCLKSSRGAFSACLPVLPLPDGEMPPEEAGYEFILR